MISEDGFSSRLTPRPRAVRPLSWRGGVGGLKKGSASGQVFLKIGLRLGPFKSWGVGEVGALVCMCKDTHVGVFLYVCRSMCVYTGMYARARGM